MQVGMRDQFHRATLYRVLAALLIVIAAALTLSHLGNFDPPNLQPAPRTIFGIRAGVGIGFVATLMDVGGGEVQDAVDRGRLGDACLNVCLPRKP
jgi:uncharacterized membrane protein YfcA